MSGLTVKQLRESLFHHFHHYGRISHLRLGYQKMEMLGHHHVTDHDKAIFLPGALQHTQEQVAAPSRSQAPDGADNNYRL